MRWNEIVGNLEEKEVYHGTPYDFDDFDFTKIGTGEGAQVFGWGIYFTETRAVAQFYKDSVTQISVDRKFEDLILKYGSDIYYAFGLIKRGGSKDYVFDVISKDSPSPGNIKARLIITAAKALVKMRNKLIADGKGKIFTVEIPHNDADYLLWDEQMEDQSPKVLKAFDDLTKKFDGLVSSFNGGNFYQNLSIVLGGDKKASLELVSRGICGVKYLDAASKEHGGSYNYVIFDRKYIKII